MGRRRKKKPSKANHERWLVSYADFITLLFAFFTSMYAISSLNESKFHSFSGALSVAFNPSQHNSVITAIDPIVARDGNATLSLEFQKRFSRKYRRLMDVVHKSSGIDGTELIMGKDSIIVRVPGGTLFRSGSAKLLPGATSALSELALTLRGLHTRIKIEGHTDNVPTSNKAFPSNWDLSSARALTVLKFFVKEHDFAPALVSATGYGEYRPIGSNDTPDGRRINRRLDIVVMR